MARLDGLFKNSEVKRTETHPRRETKWIHYTKLLDNKEQYCNEKDAEEIEALADLIDASKGVLQNLLVVKAGTDEYTIIAGHKRRRACALLVEQRDKKDYEFVPCYVENISDVQAEFQLYSSNSHHEKTDYERMVELERMKYLIETYPEEFPQLQKGRMVERLAQQMHMKKTTVGEYMQISNNLGEKGMAAFASGTLKKSAAVELSGLSEEEQDQLLDQGTVSHKEIKEYKDTSKEELPQEQPDEGTQLKFANIDMDIAEDAEGADEQSEPVSYYGLTRTVYPEGSLLSTPGCGHKHDCFTCSMPCEIRQEYRYCVDAPMGSPFPCNRMNEDIRKNMAAGMYEDVCQFLHPELAEHMAGDAEPNPCCKNCEHKEYCNFACEAANKLVKKEAAREKHLREREAERKLLEAAAQRTARDAAQRAVDQKKQSAAKQAELKMHEKEFIREFYQGLYESEKQIIKNRNHAEITEIFKKEYGSCYDTYRCPDGICWSCFLDKIVFTISGMGEALQITWGKFTTKLLHLLDDYPEIEAGEVKAEAPEPEIDDALKLLAEAKKESDGTNEEIKSELIALWERSQREGNKAAEAALIWAIEQWNETYQK